MLDEKLYDAEDAILERMVGDFVRILDPARRRERVTEVARSAAPLMMQGELDQIFNDMNDLGPVGAYVTDLEVEDVMINNTANVFTYNMNRGEVKMPFKFNDKTQLDRFVKKLKLYATNQAASGNIMDVHMPSGSRANIITSPLGQDITIRNFKPQPLSIIDLINKGTIDYHIAARLWLYTDGFKVRPANMMIGGVPGAGKTALLNTMFSFFRPERRIVTIEETYELSTLTHENTVRLETGPDMQLIDLVKNALRMRPDMIIIGEVRGSEANDMISAMSIGKICMTTMHASSSRDMVNRLTHAPMSVPLEMIPAIDAMILLSVVIEGGKIHRKVVQMSEVSGIEEQVQLSDLYKYDYRTRLATPILPSVTYRDLVARMLGISPPEILAEEVVRAKILEQLNKAGKRDMASISQMVMEYYDNPEGLLRKVGLPQLAPVVKV